MPTPEPRFEVPPEYAEVYERAYRRAYEQALGTAPTSGTVLAPDSPAPGRRLAVPRQRGGGRRAVGRPTSTTDDVAPVVTDPDPELSAEPTAPGTPPASSRRGHRGVPRTGSTLVPVFGLLALVLMLVAGAFVLGRVTARSDPAAAARPATAAPSVGAVSTDAVARTAYDGPSAPLQPDAVGAGCVASPGLSPQGVPIGYDPSNVLDADPATAWRCDQPAVGQVLDFTLPRDSDVVAVGLVPGYAVTDPATGVDLYAQNNRTTRVLWTFDDGSSVIQDLSPGAQDRSLRMLAVPRTESTHVSMKILTVDPGPSGVTLISTVAFAMAADGA